MSVSSRSSSRNKSSSSSTRSSNIQSTSGRQIFGPNEVEITLNADVVFAELPDRIVTALLNCRRIVVSKNGDIRPLPYDPDEFIQSDEVSGSNDGDVKDGHIDPLQQRIQRALEKEKTQIKRRCGVTAKSECMEDDDKENVIGKKFEKVINGARVRMPPKPVAEKLAEQSSEEKQESNGPLSALGLSEAQIDRIKNSPLWPPPPEKESDEGASDQDEKAEEKCSQTTENSRSEQNWEVAVILRPITVHHGGKAKKEYTVLWKDWSWEDQENLAPECFNNCFEKLEAADNRELLISQMAASMQRKDKPRFDELFPLFHKRHDYTNEHRVRLRMVEQSINDELEELNIAPVYFENWSDDEDASVDIKYITRCAMSFSNHHEADAIGRALRLQYPEDAAGCDCKDGECTSSCPCLKIMGRGHDRMCRLSKIDVEKLSMATVVGCGTTCSCNVDCPSRLAERVRKVPLVVLHTTIKGWCVYTPQVITKGTYLGAYVGEIVPLCSAIENDLPTTYQFTNIHQIPGTKQYVIDASRMGNVTRYFNHACGDAANLEAVSLLSRGNLLTDDKLFFAKRKIFKGEELTFSYLGKDSKKKKSGVRCMCTPGCQTRL